MKNWLIYISILLIFAACTKFSDEEVQKVTLPSHESWNSTITLSKAGKNTAIVRSGYLAKYDEKKQTFLSDSVDADFFDQDGNITSHLTSMEAEVDEDLNNLYATKNVVVISDSGVTLYTEKLEWIQEVEKIISDTLVTIVTDKDTVHGVGLESDASLTNWKIFKPVAVTERELKKEK